MFHICLLPTAVKDYPNSPPGGILTKTIRGQLTIIIYRRVSTSLFLIDTGIFSAYTFPLNVSLLKGSGSTGYLQAGLAEIS
jgi:hypothetical protein